MCIRDSSYTYENQLVGMPFSCSAIMLYYNCDMFREVGLDPNTPPTTIAEMADDISKLMVKDGDNVTRYGLNVAVRRYQLANWIGGQGDYNFFGDNEGLVMAEIELPSVDASFEKPEWIGEEVTGDPRYYNSMLARNPYKNWRR